MAKGTFTLRGAGSLRFGGVGVVGSEVRLDGRLNSSSGDVTLAGSGGRHLDDRFAIVGGVKVKYKIRRSRISVL